MKRFFAFITGALTLLTNLSSQAQESKTNNKSLLWKISGKGLTKPSYLFGTMHLICVQDYVWTDKMKTSLDKSDKICFEMDLNDPGLMMQATTGLLDNSGKKLRDYFTPEQYELVRRYLKDSLGMDIAMFSQMKPIALQTMISTKSVSCDNTVSYEDSIMKTGLKSNKQILGLEEPKEQLDVLERIPVDTVIKELLEAIQSTSSAADTEYTQLINAYKRQDVPLLYSLVTRSKDLSADMGAFLDERNIKWIPRMAAKMDKTSVFFAVGAGHLWGDNGVINLLRKNGYKVEAE